GAGSSPTILTTGSHFEEASDRMRPGKGPSPELPAMMIEVEAIFEGGVLKPKAPLALVEGTEVRLTIRGIEGMATGRSVAEAGSAEGSDSGEPSLARRTYGLIGWTGDPEVVRRIALDPEFDPAEDPTLEVAAGP